VGSLCIWRLTDLVNHVDDSLDSYLLVYLKGKQFGVLYWLGPLLVFKKMSDCVAHDWADEKGVTWIQIKIEAQL
jgi:hypothetical protein